MLRSLLRLSCAAAVGIRAMHAQAPNDSARRVMFANGEWERYARVLQDAGIVPLYPWSVRAFGPNEQRRIAPRNSAHPWSRVGALSTRHERAGIAIDVLPIETQTVFNSGFPYGYNDGPVWAGRGLTVVARGGVVGSARWLSFSLAPVAFRADNTAFALRPNGKTGAYAYGDAFGPDYIDQPQRFGSTAYQRIDPGNSTVRVDAGGLALGVSTADQWWGPSDEQPLILGNNAGGFPHVFLGSSVPVRIGPIAMHGQFIWGRLEQSAFIASEKRSRLAMGTAMVMTSPHVPGLEIGGARFFHLLWTDDVLRWRNLVKPLTSLWKASRIKASGNPLGDEPDNQLASLFARWVFPGNGFEVYGEYGREDNSWDVRDFELEPDHSAAYTVGFARTWASTRGARLVLRGEVVNTRMSPLRVFRAQVPYYFHAVARQGHTNRGQVLASAAANGGGGSALAIDRYTAGGRWTVEWNRMARSQYLAGMAIDPLNADVSHALTVENLRLRGRIGVLSELTAVTELNRNFTADAFDLRLALGLACAW